MSDTTTPYQIRNHPDFESQKQTYLEMQANGEIPTMSDTTTRCHTFMYARADCPHFLKGCVVCGGLGYVQPDPTRPGDPCPAGCDEGVVVVEVTDE